MQTITTKIADDECLPTSGTVCGIACVVSCLALIGAFFIGCAQTPLTYRDGVEDYENGKPLKRNAPWGYQTGYSNTKLNAEWVNAGCPPSPYSEEQREKMRHALP